MRVLTDLTVLPTGLEAAAQADPGYSISLAALAI